jgi:uncharacterized protein (DUF433 family)
LEIEQQQLQTILNMYNSGITSDIIPSQLDDVSQEEVDKVIENASIEQEERKKRYLSHRH